MKTLLRFLQNGKTQFHVAALAKEYLDAHNFTQISNRENLAELAAGKYYLAPFSSIVIPFIKGKRTTQVRIACAHTDFPMLKVKPNPELKKLGYLQINVEPYGGLIKESWFDRPLGLAGKVICKSDSIFHPEVKLFDSENPVAIIPNLAPHLKRGGKEEELDVQKELIPIVDMVSPAADSHFLLSYVAEKLNISPDDILDFDLYLYICDAPTTVGMNDAFVTSPRIDNISSVCAILEGLASAEPSNTLCIGALFDNEEIGNTSKQGAASILLHDMVKRIYRSLGCSEEETDCAMYGGMLLSVDVAHALHPNHKEKMDITNHPVLGDGFCIKEACSQSYATDAKAIGILRQLCDQNKIAYQRFVNRSDVRGGGTLGSVASTLFPVRTVDIGIPLLSMHSARELMGRTDFDALASAVTAYFS